MEQTHTEERTVPRQPRVLLVDDNELLARVTAEFMRDRGLEVQVAYTGREALSIVGTFQPEIVLCDLRLPDVMGIDVASQLRKDPITSNALFVLHTAYSETDFDAGSIPDVDLVLSKPLTEEKLETLLELSRRPRTKTRSAATSRPEG